MTVTDMGKVPVEIQQKINKDQEPEYQEREGKKKMLENISWGQK